MIILKLLIKQEEPVPRQDGFQRAYDEHKVAMSDPKSREGNRCDLVIKLRDEKFICHAFVFKMGSKF
jgi:hypothetical protein